MKVYDTKDIINIAVIGEHRSGKTTFLDSVFYVTGKTSEKGSVDKGTSVMDFDPEEIKRKMTIRSIYSYVEYKGKKVNFIDTPGFVDFIGEMEMALEVVENVVLVVDAERGITIETDRIWHSVDELHVAKSVVINKVDTMTGNFDDIVNKIKAKIGKIAVPVEIPYFEGGNFVGTIDVIHKHLLVYTDDGRNFKKQDIPKEYEEIVSKYRDEIFEDISDIDEAFMEKYLSGEELSEDEIISGLRDCISKGKIIPIFACSALNNIGVLNILDIVVEEFPSPDIHKELVVIKNGKEMNQDISTENTTILTPFKIRIDPYTGKIVYFKVWTGSVKGGSEFYISETSSSVKFQHIYLCFGKSLEEISEVRAGDIFAVPKIEGVKIGYTLVSDKIDVKLKHLALPNPIFFTSVIGKNRGDEDKLAELLGRFSEEDPSFIVKFNDFSKELEVHCQGENQFNIYVEILKERYKIDFSLDTPKIPYRETITKTVEAHYKHKKQTGGHGQYGEVFIRVEPLERGKGFEFVDQIRGGHIPKQFIPSVEKGVLSAMEEGVLGKYPVVDVRVILYEGSYHEVDSSDISFQIAGWHAMKIALENGNPAILEPIMDAKIIVEESYMGAITEDLNSRRGRISSIDRKEDGTVIISAFVPMSEMIRYASALSSITKGVGRFTMTLAYYDFLPEKMKNEVAELGKKIKEKINS
ncbi:MAG: elongation factor G [Brevinematales bacterium]|nr:elongation factor G [Brevinematales bacterium]